MCRADHSSREVLPTVVRLSVNVMPRKRGGSGQLAAVAPWEQAVHFVTLKMKNCTRVGTLIVATIYLQLIQNRYMFRRFTVPQCSHQHCVQPVASDVEVVGYL